MADLDRIGEEAPKRVDAIAQEEERSIIANSRRNTRVSNVRNICYIGILIIFSLLIVFIIVIRVAQLLIPVDRVWLNAAQIKEINEFFVDGSIGGLVVSFFKSAVVQDKKEK